MTINDTDLVQVQNLVENTVCFQDNDSGLMRRISFQPYEIKSLPAGMLRRLNFSRGGSVLLQHYLSVKNKELAKEFGVSEDVFDHEYNWTRDDIQEVLVNGSLEQLQDALDFAPDGIIDTIIETAIAIKVNNMDKRQAIFDKTGRNIDQAIKNMELEQAALAREQAQQNQKAEAPATGRRVKDVEEEVEESSERRVK